MIRVIATHRAPHLDEIAAIWLLRRFGQEKFPGVENAEIQYLTDDEIIDTAEAYEVRGIILLGIGGGRFDEHPTALAGRKEGECCATLVAKYLEIDDNPVLEKILEFVKNTDLKTASDQFNISVVVKDFHKEYPGNSKIAIDWAMQALEVKFRQQEKFITETKKEFEDKAQIHEFQFNGESLKLVVIISDNNQINSFARSKMGCKAAIVIQKNSSGNVNILLNRKYGIMLFDVVQIIRLEEQKVKDNVVTTDWRKLSAEGVVEGAEEWFYHEAGRFLMNGSTTHPNIPATKIPLDKIVELVKIGAEKEKFYSNCNSGKNCKNCKWYSYGLHRCRKIRFENQKQ